MKILIDESLPRFLKQALSAHEVFTVQDMGWAGIKNGELLAKSASSFDVFLTADKSLRYQQNLSQFQLSIVVFPSNRLSIVKNLMPRVNEMLKQITSGEIIEL